MNNLTIALDAMSGDFGPRVAVPAAIEALTIHTNLSILLVGDPTAIQSYLPKLDPTIASRLTVIPATAVIANDAKPSQAIRHSQGSSMRIALELVQAGQADAAVSAGNTGALMGLSKLLLHPLAGIDRPALVAVLPAVNQQQTVILDLGANAECDSDMLVQFAVMGSLMAQTVLGIAEPRVALLNIGQEESKGLDRIRAASAILKTQTDLHYIGYLEGNELLSGKCDVLVCDGFVGNVTLKTVEGLMAIFLSAIKFSFTRRSWWQRLLGGWLGRRISKNFGYLDPQQYNGACLLGLRSIIVKSHGGANQKSLYFAIKQAIQAVQEQLPQRIASRLSAALPKSDNS